MFKFKTFSQNYVGLNDLDNERTGQNCGWSGSSQRLWEMTELSSITYIYIHIYILSLIHI